MEEECQTVQALELNSSLHLPGFPQLPIVHISARNLKMNMQIKNNDILKRKVTQFLCCGPKNEKTIYPVLNHGLRHLHPPERY